MKLLAFAASLRQGSLNRKLCRAAVELARAAGAEIGEASGASRGSSEAAVPPRMPVEIDYAEFSEFDMPLYNEDVKAQGFPHGAEELARRVRESQGILLATPEYNYSIPGT